MNRKLTTEQRVFLLEKWWYHHKNSELVCNDFEQRFPGVPRPRRETIYHLCNRFRATGSVNDLPRSGRPRSSRTPENVDLVAQSVVASPHVSTRRRSLRLGVSRSSLKRILTDLKFRVYRPKLLHALRPADGAARRAYCEEMLIRHEADPEFLSRIVWSDEATFKMNGLVNRWNCVYWGDENPHEIMTQELNLPGVNCWAGIWSGGIVGPFFFDGTVTGLRYREMLEEAVIPELKHAPQFADKEIIFQQDGAPPHWSLDVRTLLNEEFPEWIGRGGTIAWPARSCDHTPCDFSMWGIVKDDVFSEKPDSLDHLRERIEMSFDKFTPDFCARICASVPERLNLCLQHGGMHFEQFM